MHMTRELQKKIESHLPSEAIEFLNAYFRKHEETIQKIKDLEKRVDSLLHDLSKKDQMLMQAFGAGQGRKAIGFQQYNPYEEQDDEYSPEWDIQSARRERGGRRRNTVGDFYGRKNNEEYGRYRTENPDYPYPYHAPYRFPDVYSANRGGSGSSGQGSGQGSNQSSGQSASQGDSTK